MPLKLLAAATAANSPPSGATAGYALRGLNSGTIDRRWRGQNDGVLLLKSTAGSGTMTVSGRVWAYSNLLAQWFPLGQSATEADRGKINVDGTVDEDGADTLRHAESISGLGAFDRIYFEITAIGGTSTAVDVWLVEVEEG